MNAVSERYADLTNQRLAATLTAEDAAEHNSTLNGDDRTTCHTHRTWARDCDWSHVNPVTGHNWCRTCRTPLADCPHRPGQES